MPSKTRLSRRAGLAFPAERKWSAARQSAHRDGHIRQTRALSLHPSRPRKARRQRPALPAERKWSGCAAERTSGWAYPTNARVLLHPSRPRKARRQRPALPAERKWSAARHGARRDGHIRQTRACCCILQGRGKRGVKGPPCPQNGSGALRGRAHVGMDISDKRARVAASFRDRGKCAVKDPLFPQSRACLSRRMEVERWRQVDISAASVTVRAYAQGLQTSTSTGRLRRIPRAIFHRQGRAGRFRLYRLPLYSGSDRGFSAITGGVHARVRGIVAKTRSPPARIASRQE